jgi:putative salt-induced outer membrane protein YdiY
MPPRKRHKLFPNATALLLAAICCMVPQVNVAAQDIFVRLRNGDRITGRLLAQETNHVIIATSWAEVLSLPVTSISGFETMGGEPLYSAPQPTRTTKSDISAAKAKPAAVPPRSIRGSIQLGSDILYGARDRELIYARIRASYEQPYTSNPRRFFRTFGDYSADYGETEKVKSANRMTGSVKTDFDLGDRSYCYNVGSGGYDEIRKIDAHYEVGPGLGYHLRKSPVFDFDVEGGVNYQVQLRSAGDNLDSLFIRAAEDATWKIAPRLSFTEKFEFFVNAEEFSQFRFRFDSTFSYQLIENLSLNLSVVDLYDTDPAPTVDENEFQIRSSIGITF